MAAKHLASDAVKKGKSIRKAAKTFGIPPSTLCDHLAIINRIQNCTKEQTEGLITSAVNAVAAGRLSASRAARVYGIEERTVRNRLKKPHALRRRPTFLGILITTMLNFRTLATGKHPPPIYFSTRVSGHNSV